MKLKELVKNLLLLLITLFLCFLFLEIGVKVLVPESKRVFEFDNVLGPKRIPNISFKERTEEFGLLTHQTNSLGFVDSEHKIEKDENVYRILFLGDSWAEAIQVPLDKSFPKILEEDLNKEFETINLGLSGFATDQEYLAFKEFGLKYNPDLVILMFFAGNDVFFNSLSLSSEPSKPYFDLIDDSLRVVQEPKPIAYNKLISFIIKNFQSPRFFYKKIELLKNQTIEKEGFSDQFNIYNNQYSSDWDKAWQISKALIKEIKRTSQENNIEFILVYVPDMVEVDSRIWDEILETYPSMKELEWDLEKPSRILEEFSQETDIKFLNLLHPLKEYISQTGEEIYGDHFNSNGHKITADLIRQFLVDNKLIEI